MRHGEISYVPAVDALKRLHSDLGGKINENKREAAQLAQSMKHVEAVIKMLRPDFNLSEIAARRKQKRHAPFKRGKGTRLIMDVLRTATEPLTSAEVAKAVLQKAGIAEPSPLDVRNARGSVHSTLRRHQGKDIEASGDGYPILWRLKF